MNAPDPKTFYDNVMPKKVRSGYEDARWHANSLLSAQYRMMTDALNRFVVPQVQLVRRVLEVGPGPGTWTKLLLKASSAARYTLVDISQEMLAQARVGLKDYANVQFIERDFLKFESSEPFDFFFSSRAIEYMPDKRATVKKITSLLLPGGRGVIVTKMPKPFFDWMRGRGSRALHGAQIGPATLVGLLRSNGLIIEEIRTTTATVPFIGSASINGLVYRFLRHIPLFFPLTIFAESYLITFRKPL